MRKKDKEKVILFQQLNLRKIKSLLPPKDWKLLQENCITYRMDINSVVAYMLKEWLHSKDGVTFFQELFKD